MGPYQRTPQYGARDIRYSGLGVRSVGPVGDFLEPPTHCQLPGDKDASVPPGAMLQCGMCDLFGQRWRLHAVKPQAGINFWPIYVYSDLELIRWKTA